MKRLSYEYYKDCKEILTIALPNGYTVIAIKIYHKDTNNYTVEFRLTEGIYDKWSLMSSYENEFFNVGHKDINSKILKWVSDHYNNGQLDEYFDIYDYELACFDYGNSSQEILRNAENISIEEDVDVRDLQTDTVPHEMS